MTSVKVPPVTANMGRKRSIVDKTMPSYKDLLKREPPQTP